MGNVKRSPWLLHYDGSSCNGCDIEVLACLTPVYDAERFGIINTGDPMQVDIFLITGGINTQNQAVVKQLYDQMPRPKVVVAVGVCACTGGVFKECYNIIGGADTTIPVDIYVPGCAARPQAIIDGIVKAIALWQEKADKMDRIQKELKQSDIEDKKAAKEAAKAEKLAAKAAKEEKVDGN
jgi:ech hydrogenase subunit C